MTRYRSLTGENNVYKLNFKKSNNYQKKKVLTFFFLSFGVSIIF